MNPPMKKFTLILILILCGLPAIQSQKNTGLFDKNNIENNNSQSNKTSDNNSPRFTLSEKTLTVINVENGTQIDIYSALGAKVLTVIYNGNNISLNNLNKGIYIVRAGKYTQKIML